jgi:hypothetical protein
MVHLFSHAVRLLLEELDIDDKRQFTFAVLVLVAGFIVYEIRARHRHGNVFSSLFITLGLSALVFLFTESEAARHWSALIFTLAALAVFAWEFLRRRRLIAAGDADPEPAGEAS